jgi:cobalt transporter subunit CbtB
MDEHGDACSRRGLGVRMPDRRASMSSSHTTTTAAHGIAATGGALLQAAFAALLGVLLLGIVGFVQIDAVHNAAHDTRHANGFPCH